MRRFVPANPARSIGGMVGPAKRNGPLSGGMGAGVAIGLAIGVAVGVALGNLAIGAGIGVAIGISFGLAMQGDSGDDAPEDRTGPGSDS